ncbi:hypothetical protein AAG570_010748 [Ranatra chinensis]|uniref:Reverse transcriptase domain-containing protein n=1 Tax=Ranatra chinensis TaxID=642074 RepID=A0ABD0YNE8_9HEMI
MIMGTDLLRPFKSHVKYKKGRWRVKLGKVCYRVKETVTADNLVGANRIKLGTGLEQVIESFESITYKDGEILTATSKVKHTIELTDNRPVYVKPRRYPVAFRPIIKDHIKEMLETGVIRESVSTFNSPLWVVPKNLDKSGIQKYRVVVDYRELNKRTKSEKYPLPRLEEMIDRMAGSRIFSVIDLKSGYHQIEMEPEDIEKTSFQFERGKYEFVRMPFGLKNAPTTFQKLMDNFLLGMDEGFVQAYMDDLIIFSRNEEEHVGHLKRVRDRLVEYGLRISADKSSLGLQEVRFMGHILSRFMRLLEIAKGIKGPKAIARAVVAYNRSIHTATDRTPLELMRGEERDNNETPIEVELERVIEKVREDKIKRTEMINELKALKRPKTPLDSRTAHSAFRDTVEY